MIPSPYCALSRVCLLASQTVNILQLLTQGKFKVSKQPSLWMPPVKALTDQSFDETTLQL